MQHNRSKKLKCHFYSGNSTTHCFLREKRKETQLWWVHTIAEVDCRNFPKFQIFATFERMTEWQKCVFNQALEMCTQAWGGGGGGGGGGRGRGYLVILTG